MGEGVLVGGEVLVVPGREESIIYADPSPAGGALVRDSVDGGDADANKDGGGAVIILLPAVTPPPLPRRPYIFTRDRKSVV